MLNDILTLEEGSDSEEEFYAAMQRSINSGTIWSLQGSMGRTAMDCLKSGHCMLPACLVDSDGTPTVPPIRDFYGNVVPYRNLLQPGTLGTYERTKELHGPEWAELMANA